MTAARLSALRVVGVISLTLAWCALWGSVSAANVLSGLLVAVCSVLVASESVTATSIRVRPLVRFFWLVGIDLVASTAAVVREVITPTDHTREAIIGVALPSAARRHLLLLYAAITVTPGTAVVTARGDGSVVYLHVLHRGRRAEVEAHVHELARLAVDALPTRTDADADSDAGADAAGSTDTEGVSS